MALSRDALARRYVSVGVVRPRSTQRPDGAQLEQGGLQPPNTLFQDPYLFPPQGAQAINLSAPQAIVGAGQITRPAALAKQLPPAMVGVIDTIDLQLDAIVLTSNVLWRITVAGAPVQGWTITVPGITGAAAAIKSWTHARIQIPLNGSVAVEIVNVDGGAYTATTTLYGWFWPAVR